MYGFSRWSFTVITLLTVGLSIGAIAPWLIPVSSSVAVAQTNGEPFPDIQDHWAQPFIRILANEGILEGYLDGTYRPEQPLARDEFAAIVDQSFDQEPIRQIESGSVYQDIPEGYWASEAIEAAYQQGFMIGYSGGFFRPDQSVSRVEALTSLSRNLNLPEATGTTEQAVVEPMPAAATPTESTPTEPEVAAATPIEPTSATATPTEPTTIAPITGEQPVSQSMGTQPATRQAVKRPLLFPLAMTTLMQPLFQALKQIPREPTMVASSANTPQQEPATVASSANAPQQESPSQPASSPIPSEQAAQATQAPAAYIVDSYYMDANQVPQQAMGDVAAATQAGIVVNYPEPNVLNPNEPITRGEIAALIHQALVYQNRLSPLSDDEAVSNYIVGR
jgi:hypothetical protein